MFFFPVEPDCNRCDYTNGQIWLQDSHDCHKYYICVKVNAWAGQWYWTNHHVSCGNLYWDMSKLTCTTKISAGCIDQDSVTETPEDDTHCKQYKVILVVFDRSCLIFCHRHFTDDFLPATADFVRQCRTMKFTCVFTA